MTTSGCVSLSQLGQDAGDIRTSLRQAAPKSLELGERPFSIVTTGARSSVADRGVVQSVTRESTATAAAAAKSVPGM